MVRFSREAVIGFVLAIVGILVTILGLKPDEWPEKFQAWVHWAQTLRNQGGPTVTLVGAAIAAFALGVLAQKIFASFGVKESSNVLNAAQFADMYSYILHRNKISEMLMFGYTNETVRDFQKYEEYYEADLLIRVLNRSWIAEKIDEDAYNEKIRGLNLRKWTKAERIKLDSSAPWTYRAKRQVRYYDFSHPFVKGIVLKSSENIWAFITFYEWQELPASGGSQFKRFDTGMIFLDGSAPEEKKKIDALKSQFELIWNFRSCSVDAMNETYTTYIR
jgi:hypothetical protein